jgi:inhibitor of KinA
MITAENFTPVLKPAGENSILVVFGTTITPQVREKVCGFVTAFKALAVKGILEIVPSYCSVMIYFKMRTVSYGQIKLAVEKALAEMIPEPQQIFKVLEVPTCYDGVLSPDMETVLRLTKLSKKELIGIHTSKPFMVYMLGFTPGFPYIGSMPFHLPRQTSPRPIVPKGSVGLAGNQTCIYTTNTPGEWWLIGRTPLAIFDAQRKEPFLLGPGDYVRFTSIDLEEYFELKELIAQGNYMPRIWQEKVSS